MMDIRIDGGSVLIGERFERRFPQSSLVKNASPSLG